MSNVIIGIIGVILFIGLAVAGATILGRDFMTASASTSAATVSSHLQQMAQGVQVLKARRGVTIAASAGGTLGNTLVSWKALEEVPVNPITPANPYYASNDAGVGATTPMEYILVNLGSSQKARDTCFAIEEQAGNADPTPVIDTNQQNFRARTQAYSRLSCVRNSDRFIAYIPV